MTVTEQETDVLETALQRISVRRPYFGFESLEEVAPGVVQADVPLSAPLLPETGAITAAQAARHMAILGSCAAALARDDNKRHHYLAMQAHYVRCASAPKSSPTAPLRAEAVATWADKRSVRSLIKLTTQDGRLCNMLDVHFAVLAPRMFERLNPHVGELADLVVAPPSTSSLGGSPEFLPGVVRIDCGPIPPEACAGHFPDRPAAPVAIVMGELCAAAGHALSHELGAPLNYLIEEGHVVASKLAGAGQRLVLEASYDRPVRRSSPIDRHRIRR